MIVLSDSGPLIALSKINYLYILNEFFSDIVIPQAVWTEVVEKGKESLSDTSLLYSETLASIFAEQGNKILAIKAYRNLMLKNPQKSVYFADLIKKLEENN